MKKFFEKYLPWMFIHEYLGRGFIILGAVLLMWPSQTVVKFCFEESNLYLFTAAMGLVTLFWVILGIRLTNLLYTKKPQQ